MLVDILPTETTMTSNHYTGSVLVDILPTETNHYTGTVLVDILPQETAMTSNHYTGSVQAIVVSAVQGQRPNVETTRTLLLHNVE